MVFIFRETLLPYYVVKGKALFVCSSVFIEECDRGMTDAIKEVLLQAGVFEGRILYNF